MFSSRISALIGVDGMEILLWSAVPFLREMQDLPLTVTMVRVTVFFVPTYIRVLEMMTGLL